MTLSIPEFKIKIEKSNELNYLDKIQPYNDPWVLTTKEIKMRLGCGDGDNVRCFTVNGEDDFLVVLSYNTSLQYAGVEVFNFSDAKIEHGYDFGVIRNSDASYFCQETHEFENQRKFFYEMGDKEKAEHLYDFIRY